MRERRKDLRVFVEVCFISHELQADLDPSVTYSDLLSFEALDSETGSQDIEIIRDVAAKDINCYIHSSHVLVAATGTTAATVSTFIQVLAMTSFP